MSIFKRSVLLSCIIYQHQYLLGDDLEGPDEALVLDARRHLEGDEGDARDPLDRMPQDLVLVLGQRQLVLQRVHERLAEYLVGLLQLLAAVVVPLPPLLELVTGVCLDALDSETTSACEQRAIRE